MTHTTNRRILKGLYAASAVFTFVAATASAQTTTKEVIQGDASPIGLVDFADRNARKGWKADMREALVWQGPHGLVDGERWQPFRATKFVGAVSGQCFSHYALPRSHSGFGDMVNHLACQQPHEFGPAAHLLQQFEDREPNRRVERQGLGQRKHPILVDVILPGELHEHLNLRVMPAQLLSERRIEVRAYAVTDRCFPHQAVIFLTG